MTQPGSTPLTDSLSRRAPRRFWGWGNADAAMLVMREELFGPLLPVVPYDTME